MTSDVKKIVEGLELIHMCCETIRECGGCEHCPMGMNCFEYNSLTDTCEDISIGKWEEFVGFADDVEEYMRELEMSEAERQEAEQWDEYDRQWKGERDERTINKYYC